jgi:hypothetical protein
MEIGEWPMDKVEVQVIELEILQGLPAGIDEGRGGVFVVPDFRVNPEIGAWDAGLNDLPQGAADVLLIAVNRCAIEMTVTGGGSAEHGVGGGIVGDVV